MVADGASRFTEGALLTSDATPSRSFSVVSVRAKDGDFLVRLGGVDDRTNAEELVGTQFVVPLDQRRTLDADEWWVEDVVGCAVLEADGRVLGEVSDVVTGDAQDRLVVTRPDGATFEVPLVDALVPEVDIAAGEIRVSLPPGLVSEDDPTDP